MATDSRYAAATAGDPAALRMRSFRDADTQVIELAGELDLGTAAELERELKRAELSDASLIAVDLRELTFIESNGIRLILAAQRRDNRLVVVRGREMVRRLFEICDVADGLPFFDQLPSEAAAARSTGSRSRDAARSAISRRVSQAALASAVLELSTRRRAGVLR